MFSIMAVISALDILSTAAVFDEESVVAMLNAVQQILLQIFAEGFALSCFERIAQGKAFQN